ncbi:hypothetical protein [Pandoraea sp.]|uniref:hypothetical protein n=1 Tax=Pandoraea sp. TaxID=1883445 RepID=UPI0035AE9FB5
MFAQMPQAGFGIRAGGLSVADMTVRAGSELQCGIQRLIAKPRYAGENLPSA